MLLKELAAEYRKSAAMMTERMKEIKEKCSSEEIGEMERLRLRRRLDTLRTMYYDTLKTAAYLENYYGKKQGGRG